MTVDRTRRFDLPGIQNLNKDQDEALALPLEGQHLVVGGPGTGKSVVALLRARRLAGEGKKYRTLVYNHLLDHSNQYLFGGGQELVAKTWESWFRELYRHLFGVVPMDAPTQPNDYRPINWDVVRQQIQALESDQNHQDKFLVIDEGQDMPRAFYGALIDLGFVNFFVAADQNQQIHPDRCSSRQDIQNSLAIKSSDTLELKINYRNTRPVALLARHFYPADPASPRPELPAPQPSATTPELWTYGLPTTPTLADISGRILQLSDRNPKKLIGIIAPNNDVRSKFDRALNCADPDLDHDRPPIQTWVSGQQEYPDFGHGGVMIINAQSCKGLEFDIAILADIDRHQPKDLHALKARFYVMAARAREQAILLRTGDVCPVVDQLLPTDPAVLDRKQA